MQKRVLNLTKKELSGASAETQSLIDYKVHVFNEGDPIILVCKDREKGLLPRKSYYDTGWNLVDLREGDSEPFDCPRPLHLGEMLHRSFELARGFQFVRVDWYEAGGRLWFGEMTFTPASGAKRFIPPEWNEEFGRRVNLGLGYTEGSIG